MYFCRIYYTNLLFESAQAFNYNILKNLLKVENKNLSN